MVRQHVWCACVDVLMLIMDTVHSLPPRTQMRRTLIHGAFHPCACTDWLCAGGVGAADGPARVWAGV
jgi:hypothetical protein